MQGGAEGFAVNALGRWVFKHWYGALASTLLIVGARRQALATYRTALQIDPADSALRQTLGAMLMESGQPAAAVDTLLPVVERDPGNAEAWFNLAYIYEQLDDLGPAESCFRRAIALQDSLDRAWYGLALVLIRQGRPREALPLLRKNIKLQPFSPYGYYQLAMTQHHLGDSGDAWRTYEQLKRFEPKYAAGLKRDLESTTPRHREPAPSGAEPPAHKETASAPA